MVIFPDSGLRVGPLANCVRMPGDTKQKRIQQAQCRASRMFGHAGANVTVTSRLTGLVVQLNGRVTK